MGIVLSLIGSRLGQISLAFLIGLTFGWWRTDAGWRIYEAQQNAAWQLAHQAELAREAKNAEEIARAATRRIEEDAVELNELRKQIADFDKGEADAKNPCVIDDAFHNAASKLRARPAPTRRARVTRPPK